ncbi:hypothetical protein ACLOJK_024007, partial [Asimina triloba]
TCDGPQSNVGAPVKNKGLEQAYKQYKEHNSKSSTLCQQVSTGFANRVLSTSLFAIEFCRVATGFDRFEKDPQQGSVEESVASN